MSKLNLPAMSSGFRSLQQLGDAFEEIEDALDNTLSRDGTAPNQMEAALDMNGNQILNLPAPSDPTDPVRLQDLASYGGGSGPVAWADITGKPSTFTPDQETVEDIVGAKVKAGTNITVSYNDTTGETTIGSTGTVSTAWADITGKPSTFTPSSHTHPQSDITNLVTDLAGKSATGHTHTTSNITDYTEATQDLVGAMIVAGTNMTVTYNDVAGTVTLASAAGSGSSLPPPIATFGTPDNGGVNTANNDVAFAAAEASTYERIYLPEGTYATTVSEVDLNKTYVGPGKIKFTSNGNEVGRGWSWVKTHPTKGGVGSTLWFTGDQKFTDSEWKTIGTDVRTYDLSASYFEPTLIPHHAWFYCLSGNSGTNAKLGATASTGSSTITLNSTAPNWDGKTIAFLDGPNGTNLSTRTVVSHSGNNLVLDSPPPSNYATGTYVGVGKRTWNGHTYVKVNNTGGGDVYGHVVRMNQNYVPLATEDHFFFTSTVGQYGGDVGFGAGSSGSYATGWESQYADNGNDVAVIGQVDTFQRSNDTGARSVVWMGTFMKSEPDPVSGIHKPADVAHEVAGKWRIGLDTSRADLTNFSSVGDNYNAAVTMGLGQRIVFNQSSSTSGRGADTTWGALFGNVKGDMFLESGNDASGDFIALRFNRGSGSDGRLRIRPNAVQVNTAFTVATSIGAGTDISLGASNVLAFGAGSGCYATRLNGSSSLTPYLHWAVNGVIYRVALVGLDV